MKNTGFLAFLTGLVVLAPVASDAAYPAARVQNNAQGRVVYLPSANNNGVVVANPRAATTPTRVTGALPRVGSATTNAGRQYYQPADYERLADSGLYIGLSAAYSASVMGKVKADYVGEYGDVDAPGAFVEASFEHDTVIPLQVSLGAAINSDLRIDFSYSRYSNFSYPLNVQTGDGMGGYINAQVSGGAITANATMLNLYYNIDSFTGYIAGGQMRPYVGIGVGLSLNTIADYVVRDAEGYYDIGDEASGLGVMYDVTAYHNGGTKEQFAFAAELGVTTTLSGDLSMDFFARYVNLGNMQTSGSIVLSWTEDYGEMGQYFPVDHVTNWQESGRLGMIDVGARLRLQF